MVCDYEVVFLGWLVVFWGADEEGELGCVGVVCYESVVFFYVGVCWFHGGALLVFVCVVCCF